MNTTITKTVYRVEVLCDSGDYELNFTTESKRTAERRSQDLAAAGYDGRIVTAKGNVVQEWALTK